MGAYIEAVDSYGYKPLHRMASNNLDKGATALLDAGCDLNAKTPRGETAQSIAKQAGAKKVLDVLNLYKNK